MAELQSPTVLCTTSLSRAEDDFPPRSRARCDLVTLAQAGRPGPSVPPRPGDRGAASCPAARPWARRRPEFSNRVQVPVRSTHSHYPGSTPAHSCLNVWEKLRQAGREPGGRARGWGPGYCARKTWFCSSLDLLTLCHRPITKRVNRSPPTPAVSLGFSVLLGKKTKDHL